MNPSLPGGASAAETVEDGAWAAVAGIGYTYVPYGELQQGRTVAANPNELAIDVHLATLRVQMSAPTGTSLEVQLPTGTLITSSVTEERTDSGIGDLEIRVRQSPGRWWRAGRLGLGVTAGLVVPTGPYVARSGAANLAPEASYLTLGRGVAWWLFEADARLAITARVAMFAQLSGRGPLSRTDDGFAWGNEARATVGTQVALGPRLSVLAMTDLQWRGGATEPDPFSDDRLMSANAGGWQWTVSPAVRFAVTDEISVMAGARIPLINDVVGNQLVPQVGGFLAVAYSYASSRRPVSRPTQPIPTPGVITVVDYWATWCAPCSEISRALAAAASRWPDVRIVKVDATSWPADGAPTLPEGSTGLPVIELFDARGNRQLLLGNQALEIVKRVDALRAKASTVSP